MKLDDLTGFHPSWPGGLCERANEIMRTKNERKLWRLEVPLVDYDEITNNKH